VSPSARFHSANQGVYKYAGLCQPRRWPYQTRARCFLVLLIVLADHASIPVSGTVLVRRYDYVTTVCSVLGQKDAAQKWAAFLLHSREAALTLSIVSEVEIHADACRGLDHRRLGAGRASRMTPSDGNGVENLENRGSNPRGDANS
jgi:hypothetical protein